MSKRIDYSKMTLEELMGEDRREYKRRQEEEDDRLACCDVTRGEYEDLLKRMEHLEDVRNEL